MNPEPAMVGNSSRQQMHLFPCHDTICITGTAKCDPAIVRAATMLLCSRRFGAVLLQEASSFLNSSGWPIAGKNGDGMQAEEISQGKLLLSLATIYNTILNRSAGLICFDEFQSILSHGDSQSSKTAASAFDTMIAADSIVQKLPAALQACFYPNPSSGQNTKPCMFVCCDKNPMQQQLKSLLAETDLPSVLFAVFPNGPIQIPENGIISIGSKTMQVRSCAVVRKTGTAAFGQLGPFISAWSSLGPGTVISCDMPDAAHFVVMEDVTNPQEVQEFSHAACIKHDWQVSLNSILAGGSSKHSNSIPLIVPQGYHFLNCLPQTAASTASAFGTNGLIAVGTNKKQKVEGETETQRLLENMEAFLDNPQHHSTIISCSFQRIPYRSLLNRPKCFLQLSNILSVNLKDASIDCDDLALLQHIGQLKKLKFLRIHHGLHDINEDMTDLPSKATENFKLFMQCLPDSLVLLQLSRVRLFSSGAQVLAETLPRLRSIKTLILERNVFAKFEDAGVLSLAASLNKLPQLSVLDLAFNCISGVAIAVMAKSLSSCVNLEVLRLGKNFLTWYKYCNDEIRYCLFGLVTLMRYLATMPKLRTLEVQMCQFTQIHTAIFLHYLPNLKQLQSLVFMVEDSQAILKCEHSARVEIAAQQKFAALSSGEEFFKDEEQLLDTAENEDGLNQVAAMKALARADGGISKPWEGLQNILEGRAPNIDTNDRARIARYIISLPHFIFERIAIPGELLNAIILESAKPSGRLAMPGSSPYVRRLNISCDSQFARRVTQSSSTDVDALTQHVDQIMPKNAASSIIITFSEITP